MPSITPGINQRDRIIEAAMRTLHAQGFNGAGVQDIAAAAGVPKGSFYNHFESKEALAAAALDQYFQAVTCGRMRILSDETLPPRLRLRRYFEQIIAIMHSKDFVGGCMIGNLANEVADHSRLIRDRLAVHFAGWTRALEGCIAEAQRAGEIRADLPAATLAAFLLNAFEGAILRGRVERSTAPFDAFMSIVFTVLT